MTDLSVTAADVRPLPGAIILKREAGGTINVGSPVFSSATGEVQAADGSAVATSLAIGILVAVHNGASQTAAADGDSVDVVIFGPVELGGATVVANTPYYVDDDAGVIADATGTKTTIIGIGLGASKMIVNPQYVSLS